MTNNARIYAAVLFVLGTAVLFATLADWRPHDLPKFGCFFALAVLASVFKVSMPAMPGKISFNFLFVLFGLVELTLAETLLIGCTAVLIETAWRTRQRSGVLAVLLATSNMALAITFADYVYGSPQLVALGANAFWRLALAVTLFFAVNTFPVAAVMSLSQHKSLLRLWREHYFWTYPYYLLGAAAAWGYGLASSAIGWQSSLLILPVLYLLYRTYNLYVSRLADATQHAEDLASLHLRTIEALALAIEAKDNVTHDHLKRVQVYAVELGRELGMPAPELEALRAASVLHDIGKLAVPEYIISKPGRLTPEEFEKMKIHPVVGAEILDRVEFPFPVVPMVRAHHEKWNGTGYPLGLKGEEIPLGARILAAVDALDALASDRQYRRALPLDEAMAKVASESGTSFDPRVVRALSRRYIELEKTAKSQAGSKHKLSTGMRVEKGLAPAAGFEVTRPLELPPEEGAPEDFLQSIAAARQDVQQLFEGFNSQRGRIGLAEGLAMLAVRLKRIIPFDAIAVYFVRDDTLLPEYVTGDNYKLFSSLRIPMGQGLSGWVVENRRPIINGNPSVESGYLNDSTVFSTLRSALSVPLEGCSGVIGALSMYREPRDAFNQENLRVLLSIAPKLAMSIETATIFDASEGEHVDAATGLPDARALLIQLETELARSKRLGTPLAVLVCNVEGFRHLNERLGKLEGASVLRSIASAIKDTCYEYDYMARMGGNEFVLILPGLTAQAADAKAEKLMHIASKSAGGALRLIVGAAYHPEDGATAEELLAKADRRMFRVKQALPIPFKRVAADSLA
ncbi:MAG: diguanylate cyclase [Acidobacteria bacterium]|nr:diguanylate cyclase [Acidobacteriota bacterium]